MEDSTPAPLDGKRRLRFDAPLNLSNLISLIAIAASAAGLWAALQAQQARMDVQIAHLKDTVNELKLEVKELRRSLERR